VESLEGLLHEGLVEQHELGEEGLNVEDGLGALVQLLLVVGGVVGDLRLELAVAIFDQLLQKASEDEFGRDAVDEQLVDALTHLVQPLRALLLHHLLRRLGNERLPVGHHRLLSRVKRVPSQKHTKSINLLKEVSIIYLEDDQTHCLTLQASSISTALRRLRLLL
jgi:hypothetical protein